MTDRTIGLLYILNRQKPLRRRGFFHSDFYFNILYKLHKNTRVYITRYYLLPGTCTDATIMAANDHHVVTEDLKETEERAVKDDSFCNDFVQASRGLLDVTFESDIFEFSVEGSTAQDGTNGLPRSSSWFPDFSNLTEPTSVDVAFHEQLAATYDDFTQDGAISVTGSIYIRTAATAPFDLTINDDTESIITIEPLDTVCKQVKNKSTSRILRVELKSSRPKEEILIANYFCGPKLRPVPLVRID
jgi:hypothetical protein